jgi:GH24 family phage-related lysozyme (muramidase)
MSPALIAKTEGLGLLKPEEVRQFRAATAKAFSDRINSIPQMTLGKPSFDNLQFIPRKGTTVDSKLTADTAFDLMGGFATASTPQVYAMSLITMGEGVALRAYDDPARGAGKNIGMGYNLKANEKTVQADLRRAQVPEERIQAVIDGTADLTKDQAKRLLQVALPRYETQVKEVANATSPGLYDRMTPAQKAVMLDVAWQVGSTDQFKKAWSALASGDMARFADETKVFYTDRSGARREDTRRNNLRASMLAGLSHWEATVSKFGSLPSSKLQAVASN